MTSSSARSSPCSRAGDPYRPEDIDVSSILLNGVLPIDHGAGHQICDDEHDDEYIHGGDDEDDDHPHNRKRLKDPQPGQIVNPLQPLAVEWEMDEDGGSDWVALMHSLDHGATWTVDATHLPNNGQAMWTPPIVVADSVKLAVVEVEYSAPGDTVVAGVFGVSDYFRLLTPTAAQDIPARLEFSPISPQPSHGATRMRYGLPRGAQVDLEVFDVQGRRVRTLVSGPQDPGWHEVRWDGGTDGGGRVGSGLYYARLRAEGRTFRQRVVWIR